MPTKQIVTRFARMWPRDVFYIRKDKRLLQSAKERLQEPGVHILYRDDHPYYIGKTEGPLFDRIYNHASESGDRYYEFWNYFSVFVVPNKKHLGEVEGILIASMITANSATPKIEIIHLPEEVARILRNKRLISAKQTQA
jgi:hypothetical protein